MQWVDHRLVEQIILLDAMYAGQSKFDDFIGTGKRADQHKLIVVDSASGKVIGGPVVSARGFHEDDAVFDEVRANEAVRSGDEDFLAAEFHVLRLEDEGRRRRPADQERSVAPSATVSSVRPCSSARV